jgi:curved DNA-binding protein CbpA
LRIKHAYNTLLNSSSRRKYDSENRGFNSSQSQSWNQQVEEEFYGLGKDLYLFAVLFGDLSAKFNFEYILNFAIAYTAVTELQP